MRSPRLTALLVSGILCGCVPFPNFHYYAPAVSGVVTQAGKPFAGAEIRVSGQFVSEVRIATTSQQGTFTTEPIRKILLTATLLGDPLYGYSVDLVLNGNAYAGYTEASVGYAPKELQLSCDLDKPIARGTNKFHCIPLQTGT